MKDTENTQKKNAEQQDSNKCPLCDGLGMIHNTDTNTWSICKCRKELGMVQALKKTGLNDKALKKSFKDFDEWNNEVKKMKNYATGYYLRFEDIKNSDNNSLALLGESGTGKTHLLLALINNFVTQKNIDIRYISYLDKITELKQNVLNGDFYQNAINKYKYCELLVIDDLFKGSYTDSDIKIMLEIINHRYINKLPFMISSEFLIEDLLQIDKAIGGRIAERTKGHCFEIKGTENNYRIKK